MKKGQIREDLIRAYDRAVDGRDRYEVDDWKDQERERFLQLVLGEGKSNLIDIGSGPGTHAVFFKEHGLEVTCIDMSPGNVERCIEKGITAIEIDVMNLNALSRRFEAAFAMNSLLHIPRDQLEEALNTIHDTLNPGGLFYWGQFGGEEREGVREDDKYKPQRFFSLLDDEQIQAVASNIFELEYFRPVWFEDQVSLHFQSLTLRVRHNQPWR